MLKQSFADTKLRMQIRLIFYCIPDPIFYTQERNHTDCFVWSHVYCSDFRYESNGIFVLGVGFFFFRQISTF